MSDYYDDDDRGKWTRRTFGATAVLAIVVFVGNSTLRAGPTTPVRIAEPATSTTVNDPAPSPATIPDAAPASTAPASTAPASTAPASTAPASTAPASTAPRSTATATEVPQPIPADRSDRYAPDGTPLPVLVVYSPTTVTLSGAVPSDDARERLVGLAVANSQRPVNVIDDLVIDGVVPDSVGIRVIELDSPRFPDGRAVLTPEHSAQFDRVAAVLRALPHVTVLVVGHADQRGDARTNWELSDERARTVVAYLTEAGIEPARLSSRAAGETDLLSIDDDATALALNRRTEFIFSGVLVP